jgi:hypothetical protein
LVAHLPSWRVAALALHLLITKEPRNPSRKMKKIVRLFARQERRDAARRDAM